MIFSGLRVKYFQQSIKRIQLQHSIRVTLPRPVLPARSTRSCTCRGVRALSTDAYMLDDRGAQSATDEIEPAEERIDRRTISSKPPVEGISKKKVALHIGYCGTKFSGIPTTFTIAFLPEVLHYSSAASCIVPVCPACIQMSRTCM